MTTASLQALINDLDSGAVKPTARQFIDLLTALHASMVNQYDSEMFPELDYMSSSLEDAADVIIAATNFVQ